MLQYTNKIKVLPCLHYYQWMVQNLNWGGACDDLYLEMAIFT